MDEYLQMLNHLAESKTIQAVCSKTIYSGAAVMADNIRQEIEALPVVRANKVGTEEDPLEGITSKQKNGLLDSFGITPIRYSEGIYEAKLGFDGYNDVQTPAYPNGQPNSLIARSVNSGTSFRKKNQFIDRAVRAKRKATESAMAETFESEFEKIMKGR